MAIKQYIPYQGKRVNNTSSDYTILNNDGYDIIITSGLSADTTITLPKAAENKGRIIKVINTDGTYDADVTPNGSENINGYNNAWIINVQYDWVELASNGTGWDVISINYGTKVEYTSTTQTLVTASTNNRWYGVSGFQIDLTEGKWDIDYHITASTSNSSSGSYMSIYIMLWTSSLSAASRSSSYILDSIYGFQLNFASSTISVIIGKATKTFTRVVSSAETLYLNLLRNTNGTHSQLGVNNDGLGENYTRITAYRKA